MFDQVYRKIYQHLRAPGCPFFLYICNQISILPIEGLKTNVGFLANEAMQYMELTCNRIPWDYNYEKVQSAKEEIQSTQKENQSLWRQIEKKDKAINSLTKGWGGVLDTGYDAKDELQCIDMPECRLNHAFMCSMLQLTLMNQPWSQSLR